MTAVAEVKPPRPAAAAAAVVLASPFLRAVPSEENFDWVLATSNYGEDFIAAVSKGSAMATQFHPEKSGTVGLEILRGFLEPESAEAAVAAAAAKQRTLAEIVAGEINSSGGKGLAKRVIACLDVRSNDQGDLVVTKGDQYDVREKEGERDVRNLGKPVDLAAR
jgi:glutamine amidotransferase/cyclase